MNRSRMQYSSRSETLHYSVTQRNSIERTDVLKDISNLSERVESSFCVSKKLESNSLDMRASEKYKYQSSGFKESGQEIPSRQSSWKEIQNSFPESSSRRVQTPESTKIVSNEPSSATNKSVNQKRDVKMYNLPRYSRTRSRPDGKTNRTPPRYLSRDTKSYPSGCHSDVNYSFLPQIENPLPNQACPGKYPERSQLNRNIGNRPDTGRLQTSHSPLDQNSPSKNTRPDFHNMKSQQWQVPPPSLRREDMTQRSGTTYHNPPMHPIATNAIPVQYKQGSSYCNPMPRIITNATPVQYKHNSLYCNSMPPFTTNATPVQYKQGSSYCNPMPYFGKNATPVQYKQGSPYCNPMPYFGKSATPMRYNQGSLDCKNATPIRHVQPSTCYQNPLFPVGQQVQPVPTSNVSRGFSQFPDVVPGRQVLKTNQDLTQPQKDIVPGMHYLKTDQDLKLPVLQLQKDIESGMQDLETVQDVKSHILQPPKDIVPCREDLKTDEDLKSTSLQLEKDIAQNMQDLKTDEDLKPTALQLEKDIAQNMQDLKTDEKFKPTSQQREKDTVQDRKDLETHQYLKSPVLQPKKDIASGKQDLETDQDLKPPVLEHQKDILQDRQDLKTDQDLESPALEPQKDISPGRHDLKTDEDLKPTALQLGKDIEQDIQDLKTDEKFKPTALQLVKDTVQDRQDLEMHQDLKSPALQPQKDIAPGKQYLKTDKDLKLPALEHQKDILQDRQDLKTDQELDSPALQPKKDTVPGRQDLKTDQDLKPPVQHHEESTTKGTDNYNTSTLKREISVDKKFQTFAEKAHYSKKNMLKVNIPKTPPRTSYFPIYATSQRGLYIRQIQTNIIPFLPPSGSSHFGSSFAAGRRIIPHLPHQTVGFCNKTYVYSNFNPVVRHQAISRPAMQNNMLIHSVPNVVIPMHPATEMQIMPPQMVQYQSATQNLTPAQPNQDLNNLIYPYGTQYPAIQNIAEESQYQNPNHPMNQYGTQHQPTHMQSTDSQYQNQNNPIYQYGTQYDPNTAEDSQYQDPNHPIYQYGGQCQPMHMQSAASQYQDPNYPIHQYGMENQPMHMQSANSQYQDPNLMYQSGTQYGPPIQDVNAEFQYQDPNLTMYQYGANSSSETFRPPQTPWSYPTYDSNVSSEEQNLNMLPMQTYATNPDSKSTIQYPTWPDKSTDQSYHMTDYLNLLPNFSSEQTSVENPSSISVSEYPSGFQAGNEFTSQGTNHYQGNMSIENPAVIYTNTYTRWSDATSDSYAKKSDDTSNNQ